MPVAKYEATASLKTRNRLTASLALLKVVKTRFFFSLFGNCNNKAKKSRTSILVIFKGTGRWNNGIIGQS